MFVNDPLAILFDELAPLWGQQIKNGFGRSAELDPLGGDDEGAIDEDRVRHHGVEQCVIAQFWIAKAEVGIGRSFLPQDRAGRQAGALDELREQRP
ncbi:hypothetical protein IT40_00475 [Paracoccus versutus]|nr:hypothetical protein IT40_00475 [Paracoccus versutus]|eukprot:jgi/Tetstr1/451710/TSEL_038746.t1